MKFATDFWQSKKTLIKCVESQASSKVNTKCKRSRTCTLTNKSEHLWQMPLLEVRQEGRREQ